VDSRLWIAALPTTGFREQNSNLIPIFLSASDERVVPLFITNSRGRAMAGQHFGFIRKQIKFLLDVRDEGLMITAGQISAADAPGKKDVSPDEDFLFGQIKAEAAGTMTWHQEYSEPKTQEIARIGFLDQEVGFSWCDF